MEYCSVHRLNPSAGRCQDCGQEYCAECLVSGDRCAYCAQSAERFLDGFSMSLNRWESSLRESRLEPERDRETARSGHRITLRRAVLGLLLAVVVFSGISFLSNYHYILGSTMLSRGNLDKAAEHLEKAAAEDPEDPTLPFMLGGIYFERGNYEEAIDSYAQAIVLDSTNAAAFNNLAWVYAELGVNLDQALALSRRSLDLAPDEPEYLDTLAEVYYKRKEYLRALNFIRRAVEQNPPNIEYYQEKLEKIKRLALGENRLLQV